MCSSKLNVVNVNIHAVGLSVHRERNSPIHTLQKLFPGPGQPKGQTGKPKLFFSLYNQIIGPFLMKFLLIFDAFLRYVGCISLNAKNSHTKNGIFNVQITYNKPVYCKGYNEKSVGLFHLKMADKGHTFCKVWTRV